MVEELEVREAKDISVGENYFLRCLVYGRSGTGKTRSLRTAPKPVGVIDTDGGMLANRGVEGIRYIEIEYDSSGPNPSAWQRFEKAVELFIKSDVRTVAVDSLTTVSDAALKRVLFLNRHLDRAPTLPDYMLQIKMLEDMITKIISSKKHLIVIAHEEFEKNEITGQIWCLPMLVGKLSDKIPIWFDEVYHSQVRRNERGAYEYEWLLRSDVMYSAKSRLLGDRSQSTALQDFIALAAQCGVELK